MPVLTYPAGEIYQGDIFRGVPSSVVKKHSFVKSDGGTGYTSVSITEVVGKCDLVTSASLGLSMLISHECAIDKGTDPWTFAKIFPIDTVNDRMQQTIRTFRNFSSFHLPQFDQVFPESFADFRCVTTIGPKLAKSFQRVASLTEENRNAMRKQLIRYMTRVEELGYWGRVWNVLRGR